MNISEWRTRRIVAVILGYWIGLFVLLGVACYHRATAYMAAYERQHPEQHNVLFIFDDGFDERLIAALIIVPPLAFLAYREWSRRRSLPPAV